MDKSRRPTMVIITLFGAAIATSMVAAAASSSTALQNQAIAQQENEAIYRIQETAMSTAAPVAHTGNLPHAVVFALPYKR